MSKYCDYKDCGRTKLSTTNTTYGQCHFHLPSEEKKKLFTAQEYEDLVKQEARTNPNMRGFICPWPINFEGFPFQGHIDFSMAEFEGHTSFKNAKFLQTAIFAEAKFRDGINLSRALFENLTNFTKTEFYLLQDFESSSRRISLNGQEAHFKAGLDFSGARFYDGDVDFWGAIFAGNHALFSSCNFEGGKVDFSLAVFEGCDVYFNKSKFLNDETNFLYSKFSGNRIQFNNVKFNKGLIRFNNASFEGELKIQNCEIKHGLSFIDTHFDENSSFFFTNPKFLPNDELNNAPRILFENAQFKPFQTYFKSIQPGENYPEIDNYLWRPIILFRFCNLKDVYFANNDMSLISFFGSAFYDETHRVNNTWIKEKDPILKIFPINSYKHLRQYQIIEEHIFEALKTEKSEEKRKIIEDFYKVGNLNNHYYIADIYRRLKTADDRTKDYPGAGYFYFNEFEMKRRGHKELINSRDDKIKWLDRLAHRYQYSLYSIYKLLTGYGEKSMLSLFWLCIMILIFSGIHLFNGLQIVNDKTGDPDKTINYDWAFNLDIIDNLTNLWSNYSIALKYTLYRILPQAYLPFGREGIVPLHNGAWDIALSIFTTIVLLLMLVFTGIGLKRHFRRF